MIGTNRSPNSYIIFEFVSFHVHNARAMLLFHADHPKIKTELKEFMKAYEFSILREWMSLVSPAWVPCKQDVFFAMIRILYIGCTIPYGTRMVQSFLFNGFFMIIDEYFFVHTGFPKAWENFLAFLEMVILFHSFLELFSVFIVSHVVSCMSLIFFGYWIWPFLLSQHKTDHTRMFKGLLGKLVGVDLILVDIPEDLAILEVFNPDGSIPA